MLQIGFRAFRGANFDSDIALDYIYIYMGNCLNTIPIGTVPTAPPDVVTGGTRGMCGLKNSRFGKSHVLDPFLCLIR